ncbi:MAG: hypothetical protein QXP53_01820 [Candidatus Pacearchaeota archaeon]
MGFLWFGRKREAAIKEELKISFDAVKQDINKIGSWISHLHARDTHHDKKLEQISEEILKIKEDIDDIKSFISFFDSKLTSKVFKHPQTGVYKQPAVERVQTGVQTGVQTPFFNHFLKNLSVSERTIVWVILNSEMKLSCDDIAALLGKDKSTVRGQINSIKRKQEGLILEQFEKNGKKRYYIEEKVRELLLKDLRTRAGIKKRKSEG